MCRVLQVSRSGFYRWPKGAGARPARRLADEDPARRMRRIHAGREGTYGSPRMTAELRAAGIEVNHKRVERVMCEYGIVGVHLPKQVRTTVPEPDARPVADLLQRDFTAERPNNRYVGGITYLLCPLAAARSSTWPRSWVCTRVVWWAGRSPTTCAPNSSSTRCGPARTPEAAAWTARSSTAATARGTACESSSGPAAGSGSPAHAERLGPAPTTPWPSRSTRPSNAKPRRAHIAGPTPALPAWRCSAGSPATTRSDGTPGLVN